jgi:hypothetical protein
MSPAKPTCPRCGYDLSGTVASWTDSCPLLSRCPECGFEIEWLRLFVEQSDSAWWLFELDHAGPVRAFVRTSVAALRPRRFWSAVRVEYAVRRVRLAVFLIVLLVLAHGVVSVWAGLSAAKAAWGPWVHSSWRAPVPPVVGPAPFRMPPLPPPTALESLTAAAAIGARAALNPYASRVLVFTDAAAAAPRTWRVNHHFPMSRSMVLWVGAIALLPLTLGAARGVFREGRARAAHLWRVWVYGWVGCLGITLVATGFLVHASHRPAGWSSYRPRPPDGFDQVSDPAFWLGPLLLCWCVIWWYYAAARYLRWERPLAVAVSACFAAFGTLAGVGLLWRGWAYVAAI